MKRVAWLFGMLLMTQPFLFGSSQIVDYENGVPLRSGVYTAHNPISIDGNDDFPSVASSGFGSAEDPWIIEGYDIDGRDGSGYCISIYNTTDHFVIRNCHLHHATGNSGVESLYGIHMEKVLYGVIRDNLFSNNSLGGVRLENCFYNLLDNNSILEHEYGVIVDNSMEIYVTNNTFTYTNTSINIDYSEDVTIKNNTMLHGGISIYG